jgi:hypothetical protein
METKQCSSCGRELSIDMFHVRSGSKDGHTNICKECKSKQDKEYRAKNKDILKEKSKKYREENKDIINLRKREYYQEHRDEILLKSAEYRETHKEQKAETDKRYAQANKEKIQQYQKEYRDSHKVLNSEYQKQYREKNKEKLAEYKKSPHVRYTAYKRNANNRSLSFDLSEDEFIEMSKLPCVYCGEYSDTYNGEWFNGIDRIDSGLGYHKDNVVPCCSICNRMKLDLNIDDWINKMTKIINYYNK